MTKETIVKRLKKEITTIEAILEEIDKNETTSEFNDGYRIGKQSTYELWLFATQQTLKEIE